MTDDEKKRDAADTVWRGLATCGAMSPRRVEEDFTDCLMRSEDGVIWSLSDRDVRVAVQALLDGGRIQLDGDLKLVAVAPNGDHLTPYNTLPALITQAKNARAAMFRAEAELATEQRRVGSIDADRSFYDARAAAVQGSDCAERRRSSTPEC